MNKNLDEAINRLRELPEEQQQVAAVMILDFLEHGQEDLLTPEQWAEVERRLDEEEDEIASDDDVKAHFSRFKA
jgi:hypothetical protein